MSKDKLKDALEFIGFLFMAGLTALFYLFILLLKLSPYLLMLFAAMWILAHLF